MDITQILLIIMFHKQLIYSFNIFFTIRHIEKSEPYAYNIFGACAAEAEVDILTGEKRIICADVVMDCGERSVYLSLLQNDNNIGGYDEPI